MKKMLSTGYDTNNHVLTVMLPLHEIKHKVLSFNVEYDVHRHFGMWHHILKDADDATKGYYEYANRGEGCIHAVQAFLKPILS